MPGDPLGFGVAPGRGWELEVEEEFVAAIWEIEGSSSFGLMASAFTSSQLSISSAGWKQNTRTNWSNPRKGRVSSPSLFV